MRQIMALAITLVAVLGAFIGLANQANAGAGFYTPGHTVTTPYSKQFCQAVGMGSGEAAALGAGCDSYYQVYLGSKSNDSAYTAKITYGSNFGLGNRPNQVTIYESSYQGGDKPLMTLTSSWYYYTSIIANEQIMVVTGSWVLGSEGFRVYLLRDFRDPSVSPANPKSIYDSPIVSNRGGVESRISAIHLTESNRLIFAVNEYARSKGTESGLFLLSELKSFWVSPSTREVWSGTTTLLPWIIENIDVVYQTGDFLISMTDDRTSEDRFAYIIEDKGRQRVIYR